MPASSFISDIGISLFEEMGAYEYLWSKYGTFHRVSRYLKELFDSQGSCGDLLADKSPPRITDLVGTPTAIKWADQALEAIRRSGIVYGGANTGSARNFPEALLMAKDPAYCLYYQGYWNYTEAPSISVVGTRKPSKEGILRTRKLVKSLVAKQYTIISGLAEGIDTAAHQTALKEGGSTIAVLGTPLTQQYPKSNQALRDQIAKDYLVISQFPVCSTTKPYFFVERNKTMAALAKATIIVEAGETSGTRIQAAAALEQGRKVFMPDSCFERPGITWPAEFQKQGAIRFRRVDEIFEHLKDGEQGSTSQPY